MTKRLYSIETPDQGRLKISRTEIEAVLKKHDLAGAVVLHTPGMSEFFYDISPSYSCVRIDEAAKTVHVKSKLADYGGDAVAQLHDQAASAKPWSEAGALKRRMNSRQVSSRSRRDSLSASINRQEARF